MKTGKKHHCKYESQKELFMLFKEEKNSKLLGSLMALALLSGLVLVLFIF